MKRRQFLHHAGVGALALLLADVRAVRAQTSQAPFPTGVLDMDGDWYKPVRKSPKAGAPRQLSDDDVASIERLLACPCPCSHDVYSCRMTDFSCTYAPSIHRDVLSLAQGGYVADEIVDAMVATYGNAILMRPPMRGVGLVAWLVPLLALAFGATRVRDTWRAWQRPRDDVDPMATPQELARVTDAARALNR